jgi:hypothetical protein
MTNPVAVLHEYATNLKALWVFCPGCESLHSIDPAIWEWDGDLIAPTISPSILVHGSVHLCPPSYVHDEICDDPDTCGSKGHLIISEDEEGHQILGHMKKHIAEPAFGNCHSFLKNGQWQFLGDSTHRLAGGTSQMVPLPDWIVKENKDLKADKEKS